MLKKQDMEIIYDESLKEYLVFCGPLMSIGSGKNKEEALLDFRKVAHFYIDSVIDEKIKETIVYENKV